jgi:murein DD-endopeptidase MepM/ murein hydrolase activator NlpD
MDYKYVAGAEALLLNNQHRRASTLKLSLLAGAALLAGLCFSHYQTKKTFQLASALPESTRAEIITAAASPASHVIGSEGLPKAQLAMLPVQQTTTPATTTPPPPPVAAAPSITTPATPPTATAPDTQTPQSTVAPLKLTPTGSTATTEPTKPVQPKPVQPEWKMVTVRKGDSLSKIFSRMGLKSELASKSTKTNSSFKNATKQLAQLKASSQMKILVDANKGVQQIVYALNDLETLEVTRKGTGYQSEVIRQKTTMKIANAASVIEHSFLRTAQKQGLDKKQIAQLVSIFKDKLNINTLRKGDQINVLFEEEYVGTKKVRTGNVTAAQITSKGQTLSAIRYADARTGHAEYYTPEGQSLRKGFTRIPLANYTYISSSFSQSRMHPISGQFKRHPAVDFAAPYGTPIKAAGAGRVTFVGSKGAYGKTIMIEHHDNISTLYAHMNGFNQAIRRGSQVQEGQTIGYVGSTGMSTGPHLHYELKIAGLHRDPLRVDLPSAAPLPKVARANFIPQARQMLAQMQTAQRTKLVSKTNPTTSKRKTKNS